MNTQTTMHSTVKRRKLLTSGVQNVRDLGIVSGKMGEIYQLERDGEPQFTKKLNTPIMVFDLIAFDGEVNQYFLDGGLKGAFTLAKIKPGMHVEIEHVGSRQAVIEGETRELQQYKIYELE